MRGVIGCYRLVPKSPRDKDYFFCHRLTSSSWCSKALVASAFPQLENLLNLVKGLCREIFVSLKLFSGAKS